jgi:hypothetical protein
MHTQEFVLFILSELVFVSRKNYPGKKNKSKNIKRTKSHLTKVPFTFFLLFLVERFVFYFKAN